MQAQEEAHEDACSGGEAHQELVSEATLAHLPCVDPQDSDEDCGESRADDEGVGSAVNHGGCVSADGGADEPYGVLGVFVTGLDAVVFRDEGRGCQGDAEGRGHGQDDGNGVSDEEC